MTSIVRWVAGFLMGWNIGDIMLGKATLHTVPIIVAYALLWAVAFCLGRESTPHD